MELFSPEFWSTLLAIVVIDLVLAGDNAIVIGLAVRNLPKELQKKVIILGTLGAIVIRAIATMVVVWLLEIPGLLIIGGVLLIWIAYKLLVENKQEHDVQAGQGLWGAIRTIVIADAAMGLDNVIAVAGAAHGDFAMVIIGLIISVPIVVWGSTLILKLIDRFPIIIYIGSAVLALTAAKMIVAEPFLKPIFGDQPVLKWSFTVLSIAGVLYVGYRKNKKNF
ncbi:MAG: TerC family protein [Bacilli bacterium]